MTILSPSDYIASSKQRVQLVKTGARTTVAAGWFSMFDVAGAPGAGTLNVGNTANGLVPDDTVAGYPPVNAFGASATGYISKVEFGSSVASRVALFDRVFVAGAYAFNAATTLATQPSYAARLPSTDYNGLEIWIEAVTAFTGNPSVAVTYTNSAGTAGRTTGTFATGSALTLGRCMQLPLQAGDSGVQKIESVTATVATVGTFNVMVLRPLWAGRVKIANDGDLHDLLRTGLPQIYDTSALYMLVAADSTAGGVPELMIEVANK